MTNAAENLALQDMARLVQTTGLKPGGIQHHQLISLLHIRGLITTSDTDACHLKRSMKNVILKYDMEECSHGRHV